MRAFRHLLVVALLVAAGYLVLARTHALARLWDTLILDNRNHYLPCDALPDAEQVRATLEAHADVVQQIEAMHPGHVGVEIDDATCPGRADLLIWYASHQDRIAIEALIGGPRFFGIPYRLRNV